MIGPHCYNNSKTPPTQGRQSTAFLSRESESCYNSVLWVFPRKNRVESLKQWKGRERYKLPVGSALAYRSQLACIPPFLSRSHHKNNTGATPNLKDRHRPFSKECQRLSHRRAPLTAAHVMRPDAKGPLCFTLCVNRNCMSAER